MRAHTPHSRPAPPPTQPGGPYTGEAGGRWTISRPPSSRTNGCPPGHDAAAATQGGGGDAEEAKSCSRSQKWTTAGEAARLAGAAPPNGTAPAAAAARARKAPRRAASMAPKAARHTAAHKPACATGIPGNPGTAGIEGTRANQTCARPTSTPAGNACATAPRTATARGQSQKWCAQPGPSAPHAAQASRGLWRRSAVGRPLSASRHYTSRRRLSQRARSMRRKTRRSSV